MPRGTDPKSRHCDPQDSDAMKKRKLFDRFRRTMRAGLNLVHQQIQRGGHVCMEFPKHGHSMNLPEVKGFWRAQKADGKAHVRTIGDSIFWATLPIFSQNVVSASSLGAQTSTHAPYDAVAVLLTGDHDAETGLGLADTYAVSVEVLKDLTEKELQHLTEVAVQLHRKMGHPSNKLLVRNLKARGADERLLAVASQLQCEECHEGKFKIWSQSSISRSVKPFGLPCKPMPLACA